MVFAFISFQSNFYKDISFLSLFFLFPFCNVLVIFVENASETKMKLLN